MSVKPAADPPEPQGAEFSEKLLDLFLYAPIGLVLDADTLAPDLARRGRQHSALARQIGELVVKKGIKRLDEVVAQAAAPTPEAAARAKSPSSESDSPEPATEAQSSTHLPIPEYDLLAASQVVKRLDALTGDELESVRLYEATTRDRRTILHKIARLQG